MGRLIYLNHKFLQSFGDQKHLEQDHELIEKVTNALKCLEPQLEEIIRERYFEGLSVAEISQRHESDEKAIIKLIYEGKRRLKMHLAQFVKDRWGIEADGICRICVHPKQKVIDKILSNRDPKSSWAVVINHIEEVIGEKFHPPQILKAHLNHIKKD